MIRVMIIVRPIDTDCIVIMQMPLFVARMGKVVTGVFGICFVVTGVVDVLVNIIANNVALRKFSFFLNSATLMPHLPLPYRTKLLRVFSNSITFIDRFLSLYLSIHTGTGIIQKCTDTSGARCARLFN